MFSGSIVALVTPFDKEDKVNYFELSNLIEFHILNKTDGILLCGTTGEGSTLSTSEKISISKFVYEINQNRIKVMFCLSSNNTVKNIKLINKVDKYVDGYLAITPYYNKSNSDGLFNHFYLISNNTKKDVILYNVPSRTNVEISINILKKLSKIKNITGIKEASGNINYLQKIIKEVKGLNVFLGNDDLIYIGKKLGAIGVISVFANLYPIECKKIFVSNIKMQFKYLNFIDSLFLEVNPIPIKTIMNHKGFNVGGLRIPLYKMSDKSKKILIKESEKIG